MGHRDGQGFRSTHLCPKLLLLLVRHNGVGARTEKRPLQPVECNTGIELPARPACAHFTPVSAGHIPINKGMLCRKAPGLQAYVCRSLVSIARQAA